VTAGRAGPSKGAVGLGDGRAIEGPGHASDGAASDGADLSRRSMLAKFRR